MTKKTEQDSFMDVLAEQHLDTMVTLSATVSEQEEDTRADVEESTRFAMRMCQDQISCNKYFVHVWPNWSRVWIMSDASRLMHLIKCKLLTWTCVEFGHPDKGAMRMLTNSLQRQRR